MWLGKGTGHDSFQIFARHMLSKSTVLCSLRLPPFPLDSGAHARPEISLNTGRFSVRVLPTFAVERIFPAGDLCDSDILITHDRSLDMIPKHPMLTSILTKDIS